MPAPVVLVHIDQNFLDAARTALEASGFAVACFSNSFLALDALEASQTINYLITGTDFNPGQPNGVSLARVVRMKRHSVRALFVGAPEDQQFVEGLGAFVSAPVNVGQLVETILAWHVDQGT